MIQENFAVDAEDLLALFELTPDLVCVADKPGYLKNFNPAVIKTLGYTREELLRIPILDLIHPDDREQTINRRNNLLNGETLLNFQNRYITKKGKVVWLEWTSIYIAEKEIVFAIAKNITARRLMEQRIEHEFQSLRHQATQFKSNLERDRKYVAAELHEDLAQLATAVKVDLDWIKSNIPASEDARNRVEHAFLTSSILVDTIRRISFAISPGMLDDLGLTATLEWYCEEFSTLNCIDCSFTSNFDEDLLSKEVQLDFFRICQEVLEHVKKQENNIKVKISLIQEGQKITLEITGINADELISRGAITIKERVDSFRGEFSVKDDKLVVQVITPFLNS